LGLKYLRIQRSRRWKHLNTRGEDRTTLLVIRDRDGQIVGTARESVGSQPEQSVTITPLPGQVIERVEVPASVARLTHGPDLHRALVGLMTGGGYGQPPIRIEHRRLEVHK
jgi:hypothetical protein